MTSVELRDDDRFGRLARLLRLRVGAGAGLRDHQVDDAERLLLTRREAHRHGRLLGRVRRSPQDAGAALRADHRVDRVLQRQDHVADGDGQRAAGAALAR